MGVPEAMGLDGAALKAKEEPEAVPVTIVALNVTAPESGSLTWMVEPSE